ncbi:MAG: SWIM zinc finger family protein, partial [Fusobacteriaceae bacterium]
MIRIDIIKNLKRETHPTIWKGGSHYFKDNRVANAEYLDENDLRYFSEINDYILGIKGEVQGAYLYNPTLIVSKGDSELDFLNPYLETENLNFFCNCPYSESSHSPCKHVVALALFAESCGLLKDSVELNKNKLRIVKKEEERKEKNKKNKFFDIVLSN